MNHETATPKQQAARKKAGLACAKKLDAAIAGLRDYLNACNACNDASGYRGADDGRQILISNLAEYSAYLESHHGKD